MHRENLFDVAYECLTAADPDTKIALTNACAQRWSAGELRAEPNAEAQPISDPGRPARPRLVRPRDLARRKLTTRAGQGALLHALCHIEFNAINLAWDAVYRFRDLPAEFYADWIRVAVEEAYHFGLLREHLRELGYDYGDFDAHNGLWEMAVETAHDPLVRMALVPRVLEARGLDVAPGISDKLAACGDERAVEILAIIQRDEVGHVAIGSRWFNHLCAERGVEPGPMFAGLVTQYMRGRVKGPFDHEARRAAGFSADELRYLETMG